MNKLLERSYLLLLFFSFSVLVFQEGFKHGTINFFCTSFILFICQNLFGYPFNVKLISFLDIRGSLSEVWNTEYTSMPLGLIYPLITFLIAFDVAKETWTSFLPLSNSFTSTFPTFPSRVTLLIVDIYFIFNLFTKSLTCF